jgi:hypothetical protein
MAIEETALDRVATNLALIAGAISTLAEAVNGTYAGKPIHDVKADPVPSIPAPTQPAATEPARRGRGRPAKGETPPPASAAPAASPAATEPDPFGPELAPNPTVTADDVRTALVALKNATDQATALKVLADAGGAKTLPELKPEKYAAVVAGCQKATPGAQSAAETDPFETEGAPAEVVPEPTLEDVKAACVAAQKRTAVDTAQKIVMKHGGSAPGANGAPGVSLKALHVSKYQTVIEELKALPTTK